eukprot:6276969-Amphidinium_carterae.1
MGSLRQPVAGDRAAAVAEGRAVSLEDAAEASPAACARPGGIRPGLTHTQPHHPNKYYFRPPTRHILEI